MSVIIGLEMLANDAAPIRGRRWALLANHAAVTRDLDPARRVLERSCGAPSLLFAPEHGLEGVAQDMENVVDAREHVRYVGLEAVERHDLVDRAAECALGARTVVADDIENDCVVLESSLL